MYRKNIVCIEFSNICSFSHPLVGGGFLESISLWIREERDTVTGKRISGFGEKTLANYSASLKIKDIQMKLKIRECWFY